MTLVLTSGAIAVPAQAQNPAQVVAQRSLGGRVLELTIATPAFTAPTRVRVYLPVGYDSLPGRRWPVTYYLAGTTHDESTFQTDYDGEQLTRAYPSIVVTPRGDSGYWTDWYNGGAFGPPEYETFVVDQLVPLIDARFRTNGRHALMGESMGGFGVMALAARHPDVFEAASSLSGAVDTNTTAMQAIVAASPELQGAAPNSIFGPRATEEVRWRGDNPVDLAENLRNVNIQIRTAEGIPGGTSDVGSYNTPSCAIERIVFQASTNLHDRLDQLGIAHLWKDYVIGCHTAANFERDITDSLPIFEQVFSRPRLVPEHFTYISIEPSFSIWGWDVKADPQRAVEFLRLEDASASGVTVVGSGRTNITTPPLFRGVRSVDVNNIPTTPDADGRLHFVVDLGPPHTQQQYTVGAPTTFTRHVVVFTPIR